MSKIMWDFPPLGSGNEQGYTNSGIELFKGVELIENLAREICQNSLDARDFSSSNPVKVEFCLTTVRKIEHAMFADFEKCISGCKAYWQTRMDKRLGNFLRGVDATLKQDYIPILLARDYNTKGLTGAKADRSKESVWRALAHSDGTSVSKDSDSAGSYGIGKNAPFACSNLSMVFYNTYAKDEERAFQGVSRLATILDSESRATQGIGHYLQVENADTWRPIFPEDDCSFRDEFLRTEYGTDIIIVGFNADDSWKEAMIQAVLANFFLAIYEHKMVVTIQGCEICAKNIGSLIYERKDVSTEMRNTYEWYMALTTPDDNTILHTTILSENDIDLFIKADKSYHNNVASFRSTGMRIRKYRKNIMQHFAAVVVIRGAELSELLRDTEPPRHNRWDYKLIDDDSEKRKKAKEVLEKMDTWVLSELQKKYDSVTEYTIDSGEGDYLPDDVDTMGGTQIGDDILRVNHKVLTVIATEPSTGTSQTGSQKGTGVPLPGDAYGNKKRKKKKKAGKKVVVGSGPQAGTKPEKSGDTLSTVNITDQRAYALKPDIGLYRVLIQSDNDYEKVYLTFSAVGEDNSEDTVDVEKYATEGKTKISDGATIGPVALAKDTPKEIFVTFKNREKMLLDIVTTEAK